MSLKEAILTLLILSSVGFFLWSVYRIYWLVSLGRPSYDPVEDWNWRIRSVLKDFFGQMSVVREASGWGHFFIFWGFIVLGMATIEMFVRGYSPDFHWGALLGSPAEAILKTSFDFAGLGVIVAIVIAMIRGFIIRPDRLSKLRGSLAGKLDAVLILGMILTLMISMFFTHGYLIKVEGELAGFTPVSHLFAGLVSPSMGEGLPMGYEIAWWVHNLIILAFLAYIPHSKHVHLVGALPNILLRRKESDRKAGVLKKIDFEEVDFEAEDVSLGVGKIQDFTWPQLLDLYACTECGRCQDNCPAYHSGKELNPALLIHNLKEYLNESGPGLLAGKNGANGRRLVGDVISEEVIWGCTTCLGCVENCPVFIEHVDDLQDMRRYLVMDQ
ncbi:4Fe-4S dicluster domain-containing protein, partial [bacterium]|nr:4Fe-4S dicluster domain-containing protein [bacterium]